MNTHDQDISITEAREETRLYIEGGTLRLRARLHQKDLAHV